MANLTFGNFSYDDYYEDEICDKSEMVIFGSFAIPIISVVITLSLTGNILVLIILALYENLKSLTNIFILNLAVSDLVFTIGLPFWAIYHVRGWVFSENLCKIVTFIFFTGFYSSILFLTIMTIYGYLVVVHPLSDLSKHSTGVFLSVLIWIISTGAAMPSLLFSSITKVHHKDKESQGCEYIDPLWETVGVIQQNGFFLVAFVVMTFCFIIIVIITRTRSHTSNKAVKLVFCRVALFFIGWVPYNVVIFLRVLPAHVVPSLDECEASTQLDYAFYACRLIAFSHCCLNPICYAFVDVKFRSHLKLLKVRMENLISRRTMY
uniref:Chemokine (C motif) receptor 1a, duplicate 1 n=1 Tax=Neolamprologus brichardi TaxID=32507 RepID=A0A3Q4M7S6_NEOBR